MNVLIAALSAPVHLNGVSRHAMNLTRALLSTGEVNRVHFVAGAWQKNMFCAGLPVADSRLHTHWVSLPDGNVSRLLWYRRELPEICIQLETDLVHLTYPAPLADGGFRCPVVLSLHDLYPFDSPLNFGALRSMVARRIMGQCIRRADAIACVSGSTAYQLRRWFPDQVARSVVIPNVVEFKACPAGESGPEPVRGHPFLLLVAQHRRNKNVPLAIRVFDRALRERVLPVDSRLVIVGITGPETAAIHACIRDCRLEDRVILLSGLSEPELCWCYRHCSALIAPSTVEGFGLPVAEAGMAGCRIVCSDIPAFREVADAGCRFVSHDCDPVTAYTHALAGAMASPKPVPRAHASLTAVSVGSRYLELYRRLLCSRFPEFDMLTQPESAH